MKADVAAHTFAVDDSETVVCDIVAAKPVHVLHVGPSRDREVLAWWVRLHAAFSSAANLKLSMFTRTYESASQVSVLLGQELGDDARRGRVGRWCL